MSSSNSDFALVTRLLPVVGGLVALTLVSSWFVWFLIVRGFGGFPFLSLLEVWDPLGGFLSTTVRWTGLLLTLGYVVRRASE